ncbi:MAG: hypothetical protein WD399_03130 [Thermoleophilaceae bacterium]
MQLDADDIEQIARRVANLLSAGQAASSRYLDAATLAAELGVDRHWVYANADRLGAIRLGGPHGRLRFDRQEVRRRLVADAPEAAPTKAPTRRRRAGRPSKLIRYDG